MPGVRQLGNLRFSWNLNSGCLPALLAFPPSAHASGHCFEFNSKQILTLLDLPHLGNFVQIDQKTSFSLVAEVNHTAGGKWMDSHSVSLVSAGETTPVLETLRGWAGGRVSI